MKLDHATIATPHLDTMRDFLCNIASLTIGPRPAFSFDGLWLYHDDKAVIHLIKTKTEVPPVKSSRIDHIAFRVESIAQWEALIVKLADSGIEHRTTALPDNSELQLFAIPVPGVVIEFVTVNTASA
ncbi:extradiol dioxygenase [Oxalicibacterium faecigallinarum]|uniref:Diguanylate cyclase n=1 Tax=Oxalicibacterium faecigallinarum TaxID=573741 RepID=A0A8J3AQ74_9BURK|nr:extradiol dioxygenase [Oxalicibacterium faecigallinarum]GGI18738.1 diguanylate cyclase [Oxalicibacterium faecigallinarum]